MKRLAMAVVLAAAFGPACASNGGSTSSGSCKTDGDCKGSRVCEAGECTDVASSSAGGTSGAAGTTGSQAGGAGATASGGQSTTAACGASCVESFCPKLIAFCQWGVDRRYFTGAQAAWTTCDQCVTDFRPRIQPGDAFYCPAGLDCWYGCTSSNPSEQAGDDCIANSCAHICP